MFIQLIVMELKSFYRNPGIIFWAFGFPLIMAGALGAAFSSKKESIRKIGIIGENSLEIVNKYKSIPIPENSYSTFEFISLSKEEAIVKVKRGEIQLYLESSDETNFYFGTDQTASVTLQWTDGFRLLNNVATGVDPVPGCVAGQLSGTRVNQLLDFSGFPNSMRLISPGQSTMQADPGTNRSILAAIQTVEQSEFGAFFMRRSGQARFLDRNIVSQLADATPRFYSDTALPGSLTYSNLDFAYDDQLILNDVTVTRYDDNIGPDPVPQNVFDQESIDKYFTKSGQRSDILVQTDQQSNDQARTLLVARKDADVRIDSMSLNIYSDISDDAVVVNLSSDIYNLVVISKLMPGGSFVTRELFIQGVQYDITPESWTAKFLTAEPIIQAFIIGSTNQGILDVNNLSY